MTAKIVSTTALAALMLIVPQAAIAGSFYAGIEGGLLHGRANDLDEIADFTTTQDPATPAAPPGPADVEFDDVFAADYKTGTDLDVIGGYDFGILRLELELARKRAPLKRVAPDDFAETFITDVNAALNRPSAAPDPGAPGSPALTIDDFDVGGSIRVLSAMINGLIDVKVADRFSLYGGGGYGRARGSALGGKDSAWAFQYMVGARYAVSPRIDFGLKYRYFDVGILKLQSDPVAYSGNPNRVTVIPPGGSATPVDQTTDLRLTPEIEGHFRSRQLLASLIYNFR